MLLGLWGHIDSGKTAAQEWLNSQGFWSVAFADRPKIALCALLDIRIEELERLKKSGDPVADLCGKTIREALEKFGTEWGRDMMGADIWVNLALKSCGGWIGHQNGVITDVRYRNEAQAVKLNGGYIIRLESPGGPKTAHSSGNQDLSDMVDYTVTGYPDLFDGAKGFSHEKLYSHLQMCVNDINQRTKS